MISIKICTHPDFISNDGDLAARFNYEALEREIFALVKACTDELPRVEYVDSALQMFALYVDEDAEARSDVYLYNWLATAFAELDLSDERFYQKS